LEAAEAVDDEEGPDIEIPQAVTQVRDKERERERERERELARCRWPLQRHHL